MGGRRSPRPVTGIFSVFLLETLENFERAFSRLVDCASASQSLMPDRKATLGR